MTLSIRKIIRNRKFVFLVFDAFFIILSFYLAFLLRFEGQIPENYLAGIIQEMIIIALFFSLPVFNSFGLYSFSWSYVSAQELIALFKALTISFTLTGFSLLIFRNWGIIASFPRSTLIISYFLVFILSGGIRFLKRVQLEVFKKNKGRVKTLIVGAGDAGEQILRSIKSLKESYYLPVGFVDDSLTKKGVRIHGLPVLGKIEDISEIVLKEGIEEMIIALPSVGSQLIKKTVELGRKAGLKRIKIVPPISEIMNGEISLGNLREISVEDLLGREPVKIDTKAIENFIKGKSVLITGAAGSIGSELSRQIVKFNPSSLFLLDQDETGIFNILNELKKKFSHLTIKSIIADICDNDKIERIFFQFKPKIVFHAAAYKHVPLMEEHFDEAIKNNVFGTKIVAESALKNDAEKFIFISTDKAVNPSSIMGATKRIGEMVCQFLNQRNFSPYQQNFFGQGKTKFISVRFGNVLDSRGSVIPLFREKIKRRESLEVTHPEMKRYFMMISEACLLVMQAAEMGQGGEVFVLDMGKPIKILDLAKEMIKLAGLEPDRDIPIVFTGVRPGEKLFEEILTAEEGTIATRNQNIFVANLSNPRITELNKALNNLKEILEKGNKEELIEAIKEIVPSFVPNNIENINS